MLPRATHRSGSGLLAWLGIRIGLAARTCHPAGIVRPSASPHSSSAVAWRSFSDPLLDQDGHAGGSGHDLVIVAGRLADHVDDGRAMLVGDENSPDPLANPEPDPVIEAEGGGDVHEGGLQVAPVSLLDRRLPGPAGCGQELALAPAIAPAHDLEPPITPDRQPGPVVAIEKADFALASTLVSAAIEPVSCNQLRGQLAPCQGNSDTHGLLEWPVVSGQ